MFFILFVQLYKAIQNKAACQLEVEKIQRKKKSVRKYLVMLREPSQVVFLH